jgi:xanthine dehydrogenase molybdopterin binding subunit
MDKWTSHESAWAHVTGEAVYVDDIAVAGGPLVGYVFTSPHAHARIRSFDLREARSIPGVHAVLGAQDIPGRNQVGAVVKDEVCLATGEVECVGQAIFLIAAETEDLCREAAKRIIIAFEQLPSVVDLPTAMAGGMLLGAPRKMERGNPAAALRRAPHRLQGELHTGAQEHWYLETQVALSVPGEGEELVVYSSTQHPSETQALVADVLGIRRNDVAVEVRRLGGGFGGKETQANHPACWSALLARATHRPVKVRLFRDDDMCMTGKRHRYLTRYEAGFDEEGRLLAVALELNADGGMSTDLSFAVLERAMLHVDNAYFIPNISVVGCVWKTHLPSNTAFRGFGGPQGMAVIETIIDRVARMLRLDAAEVRRRNFYAGPERSTTHYGQVVEGDHLQTMFDRIVASSEYGVRRSAVREFNSTQEFRRRGLALTPVKFGISFTTTFLNQAGALVLMYTDGTVLVNHGGVEMGQGLHTKIRTIAAGELGIPVDRVRVNATNTSRIPNTSATAASSGADLNGMAVKCAIDTLKARIVPAMVQLFNESHEGEPTRPEDLRFAGACIIDSVHPDRAMPFAQAMQAMHLRQIPLSAAGFFSTPGIGWDKQSGKGRPFLYYAFGMAVTEVELDILTGGHTILRTDILHDVGDSLHAGIDRGQIEGGFIQGAGWCTTEEIIWDEAGRLLTHSPDTYKIPTAGDIPPDFRVTILDGAPNPLAVRNSKAVGEPPFMLALSVWLAIKDAICADAGCDPHFPLPATREVILNAIEELRQLTAEHTRA